MVKKWLSKPGSRFLYGIAWIGISLLFLPSPVLFLGFMGMCMFLYGSFTSLSLLDDVKCRYLKRYSVVSKQEVEMQYILVQARYHAYVPVIVFVSPYFYFAYKKEYYLIPMEGDVDVRPGARIPTNFIHYNGAVLLTDADYAALTQNPQAVLDRLVG